MLKKYPSAATPITNLALLKAVAAMCAKNGSVIDRFEKAVKVLLGVNYAYAYSTGAAAFYVLLEVFKQLHPGRNIVILPAYTAPILMLPIKKAGLEVRLVDISLDTFGIDPDALDGIDSENVLCIVAVHLLGVPMDIVRVNEWASKRGIFVVEDAAQSFGAAINGKMVGGFGDAGIISFQRGKNLSTFTGGALVTNRDDIACLSTKLTPTLMDMNVSLKTQVMSAAKLFAVAKVVNPYIYRLIDPLIADSKSREVHEEFDIGGYTDVQAAAGLEIFSYVEQIRLKRHEYGEMYRKELSGLKDFMLPMPLENTYPVYCQFPLVVKDPAIIPEIESKLTAIGLETTRRYLKPLHLLSEFAIQYSGDNPYPNAAYFAERLLCLPVHPLMNRQIIRTAIRIIREL